jgi:hypothetical protein
MILQS